MNSNSGVDLAVSLYVLVAFIALLPMSPALASGELGYQFGVFPYLPPARLEKAYAPVAADFSRVLHRPVHLHTASNFDNFDMRLKNDEFDIVLIQPLDVVPIIDEKGYVPLASKPSHPSQIVVLNDSPLTKPQNLKGKVTGLAPKGTTLFALIPLMMEDMGLGKQEGVQYRVFPSILTCLHQLLLKRIDACSTGGGSSYSIFEKKMKVKLRVLMKTPAFPHMIYAANPRLPKAEQVKLKNTILNWQNTQQGRMLLKNIGATVKYIPYRSTDYNIIRDYRKRWQKNAKDPP